MAEETNFGCNDLLNIMEQKDDTNKILNRVDDSIGVLTSYFKGDRDASNNQYLASAIFGVKEAIGECCCNQRVAIAELNGKIDVYNKDNQLAIVKSEMKTHEKLDHLAREMERNRYHDLDRRYADLNLENAFNSRCMPRATVPCGGSKA